MKRNLRRESRKRWIDFALRLGSCHKPRPGKKVFTGVLPDDHPKIKKQNELPSFDQVFQVIIRTTDYAGNPYLIPETEVEVYWTNLFENPETIIDLYHDHGTSEQFHSELKTDMNIERLPSGKFAVNALILHTAMIAFNTLRFIGQTALKHPSYCPIGTKGNEKGSGK